ncbi:MAG: DUF3857 domain-containing protein [Bacteroidales bacterium]|nr:DUF3857 domain-containing protein [Bacteroidales bacterium]MBN2818744.1 DUF3857 domain-containing protein [Bacteroidales bacterium]
MFEIKKMLCKALLVILTSASQLYAQHYPVDNIPDSLKEQANSVLRYSSQNFIVKELDKCQYSVKQVVTILNKDDKNKAELAFTYSEDRIIKDCSAKLFNKYGFPIASYSKNDFDDNSYDPYGSLFSDTRYLYLSPIINEYPVTISYEVDYVLNKTYSFPDWMPVNSFNQSVEESNYSIEVPEGYKFSFKEYNCDSLVNKKATSTKATWKLTNHKAIEKEPWSIRLEKMVPNVKLSPTLFEYDGYAGDFTSWYTMGLFFKNLNSGLDILSEETVIRLKQLTEESDSDIDKVKSIYEYMQSVTKYVSIQIGIGGIKPFSSQIVEAKGYGDCKALSNFMYSLLKSVGIKSHYALIKAGLNETYFDTSFVHTPFNHVILCVPLTNDTVWLECTNQSIPFGFLGDFTDNRYALLITENGGALRKTPTYPQEINQSYRKALVKLYPDGNATANVETTYHGLNYDNIFSKYLGNKPEVQKKQLYQSIDIPNFTISEFSFNENRDRNPTVTETLELELNRYCSSSNNRLFVPLNLMNKSTYVLPNDDKRSSDIEVNSAYVEIDSITYILLDGYEIEHLPENVSYKCDFGSFSTDFIEKDNMVIYIRKRVKNNGIYSKELYSELALFYKNLKKADNSKLILHKLEN